MNKIHITPYLKILFVNRPYIIQFPTMFYCRILSGVISQVCPFTLAKQPIYGKIILNVTVLGGVL